MEMIFFNKPVYSTSEDFLKKVSLLWAEKSMISRFAIIPIIVDGTVARNKLLRSLLKRKKKVLAKRPLLELVPEILFFAIGASI